MFKRFVVINRKILPYQKNVNKNFFDIEKIVYKLHKSQKMVDFLLVLENH